MADIPEARLNITWNGVNGELPDPVPYDATEADLKAWAQEAIRGGSIPGIPADPQADLNNMPNNMVMVVDRFPAQGENMPNLFLRPDSPLG